MIRAGFGGIAQARRELDGMHDGALRIKAMSYYHRLSQNN